METLCIIPARGGSKSIPKKNLRRLADKPLIAHAIEKARKSRNINRVIVSTDDSEISEISKKFGAEVIIRPREISGDSDSSELALLHALDFLLLTEHYSPDLLVFLQCTAPLTLPEHIDGTVQTLLDEDADTALSVTPFHYFLWRRDEFGYAMGINHEKFMRPLRQQREPQFLETGAVYVMRVQGFKKAKHRFFGKTAMYVMPAEYSLEIDEEIDFHIAEVLLQKGQGGIENV